MVAWFYAIYCCLVLILLLPGAIAVSFCHISLVWDGSFAVGGGDRLLLSIVVSGGGYSLFYIVCQHCLRAVALPEFEDDAG